jgi:RND family efflux transporter MFP subunit
MKHVLITALLCVTHTVFAGEFIAMTAAQQQALDIRNQKVEAVTDALSPAYPAQVVVPNAQLRVVSAPQEGLLATLLVAEGDVVKEGQAMAEIRSPALVDQQSAYLAAVTRQELAAGELRRDRQLHQEGIIAERRFQETRSSFTEARTETERLRQTLQLSGMSESDLERLARERRLSVGLTVRSPLDGVVLEQMATPGQRLDTASPLYKVGRLDPLWLEIHVPLDRLGGIGPGTGVHVENPDVEGQVITVGQMVHPTDQGVLVRAEVASAAGTLKPGQFVQVRLESGSDEPLFRVPNGAVVRNQGRAWVLVAATGGFRPVAIDPRAEEAGQMIVTGPLSGDDLVAVSGTAALKAAWLGGDE